MLASHLSAFDSLYSRLTTPLAVVEWETLAVKYLNNAFRKMTNKSEDADSSLYQILILSSGATIGHELLEEHCHTSQPFFCRNLQADSSTFHVIPALLELDAGKFFVLQAEISLRDSSILPSSDSRLTYALSESCDGLWDWNTKTNEVYFSPKLDRMLGFEPGERKSCLEGWADLVHPDDADIVQSAISRHVKGEVEFYDVEYSIRTKQGEWKQVRDRGQACDWNDDGDATRVIGMLSDITAYRELEQELRHTRDRFEDFALCGSDWFWETDVDLNITSISSQFSRQTGVDAGAIKGRNIIELMQGAGQGNAIDAIKSGLPIRNIRLTVGGQGYWIALSGRSVFDEGGSVCGYRGVGENIHDQVMLERAVESYKQNAEIMMDRAPAAIGMVAESGQFYYSNDAFLKLLRSDKNNLQQKYKESKQFSRPDKDVFQTDDSLNFELILETLDGPRFYSVMKYRLYRASENARLVVTVAMDITYTRHQEVEQKKTEMVLNNIAEGILITDVDHKIVSANRSMQETTGYSLEELIGNTPAVFSSGRYDKGFYQELWNEVHQSGKWRGDIWNRCRNGSVMRQHVSIQAIMVNGQIRHYIGIYSSAYQASTQRDSEMFAQQHDPLTSLPNRQLFHDRLHMACQRSRACRQSVDIAMVRIGDMTALNKEYGHTVGDQILKRVAFNLQDGLALDDTVARYSADEFVVLRERGLDKPTEELIGITLDRPIVLSDGRRVFPEYSVRSVRYPDQGSNPHRLMRQLNTREPD